MQYHGIMIGVLLCSLPYTLRNPQFDKIIIPSDPAIKFQQIFNAVMEGAESCGYEE